jgi:hypothetical protein
VPLIDPTPPDSTDPRILELQSRVSGLERTVKQLAWGVVLVTVATVGGALMLFGGVPRQQAITAGDSGRIEATEFVLKDDHGKARAVLGIESDGQPMLRFSGHRKGGIALGLVGKDQDFPGLVFRDNRGKDGLILNLDGNGGNLVIADKQGHPSAHLAYSDLVGPYLSIQDSARRSFVQLGVDPSGQAHLELAKPKGNVFFEVPPLNQR